MTRTPAGVSLVETLVALVITSLLLGLVAATLHHQNGLVRRQAERAAFADAARVTATVLQGELRWLDPTRDIVGVAPRSVELRAVRALAVVCGWRTGDTLVRLRGVRRPDPAKDSVLLVPDGRTLALRNAAEEPDACPHQAHEAVFRLALDWPAPRGALLLFEHGSYTLTGHAFRYLRGKAGRQPLTAEALVSGEFTVRASGATLRLLDVHLGPAGGPRADVSAARVVFANAAPPLMPDTVPP